MTVFQASSYKKGFGDGMAHAASRQSRSKALLENLAARWEKEAQGIEDAKNAVPVADSMAAAEIELRATIHTMRKCAADAREFSNVGSDASASSSTASTGLVGQER